MTSVEIVDNDMSLYHGQWWWCDKNMSLKRGQRPQLCTMTRVSSGYNDMCGQWQESWVGTTKWVSGGDNQAGLGWGQQPGGENNRVGTTMWAKAWDNDLSFGWGQWRESQSLSPPKSLVFVPTHDTCLCPHPSHPSLSPHKSFLIEAKVCTEDLVLTVATTAANHFFLIWNNLPNFFPNIKEFAISSISRRIVISPKFRRILENLQNFEEFLKIFKISKNFEKSSKFRRILENLRNLEEFFYNHTSLPSFGRKKAAAPNLEDFFYYSTFQHQFFQKNCCCCFYNIFIHINMYIIKTFIWEGWGYKAGV